MNIVCRFNAGKRMNLIQRGSFQTRANLSSLRYNKGASWHYSPWEEIMQSSPGQHFKTLLEKQKRQKRRERTQVQRELISAS